MTVSVSEKFPFGQLSFLTAARSENITFLFASQFLISGSTDTFNGGKKSTLDLVLSVFLRLGEVL